MALCSTIQAEVCCLLPVLLSLTCGISLNQLFLLMGFVYTKDVAFKYLSKSFRRGLEVSRSGDIQVRMLPASRLMISSTLAWIVGWVWRYSINSRWHRFRNLQNVFGSPGNTQGAGLWAHLWPLPPEASPTAAWGFHSHFGGSFSAFTRL